MKLNVAGGVIRRPRDRRADRRLSARVHALSDASGAGVASGQAAGGAHRSGPARESAVHRQRRLCRQAHPRSGSSGAGSHRLRPEAAGGGCLRALPHSRRVALLSDARLQNRRRFPARHPAQFGAAARAGRGDLHPGRARPARRADGAHPRSDRSRGGGLRHPGGRRAHTARRSAGAEQPGGLQAHADRAPARGGRVPRRRQSARPGNPLARRPRGDGAGGGGQFERRADPRRG